MLDEYEVHIPKQVKGVGIANERFSAIDILNRKLKQKRKDKVMSGTDTFVEPYKSPVRFKKCTRCGQEKQLHEFWTDKSAPDGKYYWCKECAKAKKKANAATKPVKAPKTAEREKCVLRQRENVKTCPRATLKQGGLKLTSSGEVFLVCCVNTFLKIGDRRFGKHSATRLKTASRF